MASAPPSPDERAWRELAERAIRGDIETLESRTADGSRIAPLYPRRKDDPPQPWREGEAWAVAQRIDHPDPEMANRLALADLEGGADALILVGPASPYARGYGVDIDPGSIDLLLDKVELDLIALRLDAGPATGDALETLAGLIERRHLASAGVLVDVGFDPIGWKARLGVPHEGDPRRLLELRGKAGLTGEFFLADGRPYHEAGASEAQELAAVLATAVAHLRQAEALGLTLDDARKSVALLMAADADVLLGLAKFRAIRRLWARVETASGLDPVPVRLHAETSWRMMTRYDPWTNVMRTTAAAFAAGLGGADCITVLPFTTLRGLPEESARRLARNTQRILLDEAHLAMVADPTAGTGGFEALTDMLCHEAWTLFQDIERNGGMEREGACDLVKAAIAKTAGARAQKISDSSTGIVGTSRYASLDAPDAEVLEVEARATPQANSGALPILRDAAPFEALRDRAEEAARGGKRPHVFLATLGAPSAYGPQVSHAINFLASTGIAAQAPLEEREIAEQLAEFSASETPVACLCAPESMRSAATEFASRLRASGATHLLSTGKSITDAPSPDKDGIDAFIEDGSALSTLTKVVETLLSAPGRA